jgi:hypothetical protein
MTNNAAAISMKAVFNELDPFTPNTRAINCSRALKDDFTNDTFSTFGKATRTQTYILQKRQNHRLLVL